jgi:hypothetical protein
LNGLDLNNQLGGGEKNEQRCVKNYHASREITRPVLFNLLAERPVLGQPDSLTKGFILQISATAI